MVQDVAADKPYRAVDRGGYWVCMDMRTGEPASYPTNKVAAQRDARFMNDAYAEALGEQASA